MRAHIKAGPNTQATTSACAGGSGAAEIREESTASDPDIAPTGPYDELPVCT